MHALECLKLAGAVPPPSKNGEFCWGLVRFLARSLRSLTALWLVHSLRSLPRYRSAHALASLARSHVCPKVRAPVSKVLRLLFFLPFFFPSFLVSFLFCPFLLTFYYVNSWKKFKARCAGLVRFWGKFGFGPCERGAEGGSNRACMSLCFNIL